MERAACARPPAFKEVVWPRQFAQYPPGTLRTYFGSEHLRNPLKPSESFHPRLHEILRSGLSRTLRNAAQQLFGCPGTSSLNRQDLSEPSTFLSDWLPWCRSLSERFGTFRISVPVWAPVAPTPKAIEKPSASYIHLVPPLLPLPKQQNPVGIPSEPTMGSQVDIAKHHLPYKGNRYIG